MTQKHDSRAAFEKWLENTTVALTVTDKFIAKYAWNAALSAVLPEILKEMEEEIPGYDSYRVAIAIVKKYIPEDGA